MRYRPTPLNIISTILIVWTLWDYNQNKGDSFGYGAIAVIYIIGFCVCGLVTDLIIQWFSTKYSLTFGIETILILLLGTYYSYSQRTKTLIIPDSPTSNYIVTVYGVKDKPKLTDKILPWTYEVKVPENGILLTASAFWTDLPQTKMVSYSGTELNTDKSDWGWIRFSENEFDCNGQTYKYRSWMINKEFCCGYSNKDEDSLKVRLQRQLCDELIPSR
jgi:hypothetical protein